MSTKSKRARVRITENKQNQNFARTVQNMKFQRRNRETSKDGFVYISWGRKLQDVTLQVVHKDLVVEPNDRIVVAFRDQCVFVDLEQTLANHTACLVKSTCSFQHNKTSNVRLRQQTRVEKYLVRSERLTCGEAWGKFLYIDTIDLNLISLFLTLHIA